MYGYIITSGTCALVVPWHVSGFGYATALTTTVVQLEKELTSLSTIRTDLDDGNQLSLENRPPPQGKPSYASCVKTEDQKELLQLQSQGQSLTTQHRKMTEEKNREEKMQLTSKKSI